MNNNFAPIFFQSKKKIAYLSLAVIVLVIAFSSCATQNGEGNPIINNVFKCNDGDGDHLCDICAGVMSNCTDSNLDHICDLCGKETVKCPQDEDWNHLCDICGDMFVECFDKNNDHVCDYCKVVVMGCKDLNFDHFCDGCKLKFTDCEDSDKNHHCDICETKLSSCKDGKTVDHICEYCGEKFSSCYDTDKNHECDHCLVIMSVCEDASNNHKCDVCDKILSECVNEGNDDICDICGIPLPWLVVKMAEGFLVNGAKTETVFQTYPNYLTLFSCAENSEIGITGWIIYDTNGVEVDKLDGTSTYRFNEGGEYYVVPVFEND